MVVRGTALAILAAFALAAPAGAARLPRPCGLLSARDVAQALGSGVELRTAGHASCTWSGRAQGFYGARAEVTLAVARATRAQFVRSASVAVVAGATPGTMRREPAQRIAGVGQVAYFVGMGSELAVWDHGTVLYVSTVRVSTPLAAAKRLARAALARL
jgi:hypothetical protein